MRRILFVDDEPRVLEGLRRSLHGDTDWEVEFAEGGEEALGLAVRKNFDVVVSDIRMPGMDGAALLRAVRERYPGAIRLALSGYFDVESAVRSSPVAHQFLAKPCERATLRAVVDRALRLGDQVGNETVRRLVAQVGEAPCSPDAHAGLMQTLDRPDATLGELTQIAEQDVGIAAKIMQMVNSPFFGLAYGVATVQAAVGALGIDILRQLTLSAEAFQPIASWAGAGADSLAGLQAHSRLTAAIASQLPVSKRCAPRTFIAALLHDVGKLVLGTRLPEAFEAVIRRAQAHRRPIYAVEREMIGATHAEAGAYLLGLWSYPDDVVEAVLHHHAPCGADNAASEFGTLAAVHVANALARELGPHDSDGPDPDGLDMAYLEKLGVAGELPAWTGMAREAVRSLASGQVCLRT
jgi:HD-like signal output (HDOD) protein/CheY-like chemotaxis protein